MKITILNGNPQASNFDSYLKRLQNYLENQEHTVTLVNLRDLTLLPCVGCWGCWVKTPGECITRDASLQVDRAIINADFLLWAAPMKMGFPTALLKTAIDKQLPLLHPYVVVDHGEAHHMRRYQRYPRVGLLVEKEDGTDQGDLQIATDICSREALNLKSCLVFSMTTENPIPEIADKIITRGVQPLQLPGQRKPVAGMTITPPTKLTLFNGSPRGENGSTSIFLQEFAAGFGGESEMHHLIQLKKMEQHVQAFASAECVLIGFPLYWDAMPGSVKLFFEALGSLVGRNNNPPVGFVVQSGFPEGLHSRYVEHYLEKLAARLGSPYLGTIVKGSGGEINFGSPTTPRKLTGNLRALGAGLRRNGFLDPGILASLAMPERYPAYLGPFFSLFLRLPIAHSNFDSMLKENGAFEQRYARPFYE